MAILFACFGTGINAAGKRSRFFRGAVNEATRAAIHAELIKTRISQTTFR
jgi:hypothetical protein